MNKVIKTVDFSDVHPLVAKNYKTLYSNIVRALGRELSLLFAPMQEEQNVRKWTMPDGVTGNFRSIVDAPDDDQGLLALLWEEKKAKVREVIAKSPSVGDLEKIIIVPNTNYIYYSEVPGAEDDIPSRRFRLLITGWACEFGTPKDKGKDVATNKKVEAGNNHQAVTLELIDEKGDPMANADFVYIRRQKGKRSEFTSNSIGRYEMGPCLVGDVFIIEYLLTQQQRSFEVQKNVPLYKLQFAPFVDATVKVVNQHDEPQDKIEIVASYGNQTKNVVTDGLGMATIQDLLYQGPNVLMHLVARTENNEAMDVFVQTDARQNSYILRITTIDPLKVRLLVKVDGQPAQAYNVRIDCAGNTAIYSTDPNGLIPLPFLKENETFTATSTVDETIHETYTVLPGQELYILNIEKPVEKPIEQPETPDSPVVPNPPKRFLLVRDASGNPVPHFIVKLTRQGNSIDMQTDAQGRLQLPEDWVVGDEFSVEPVSPLPKVQAQPKEGEHIVNATASEPKIDFTIIDDQDEYIYDLPLPEPDRNRYVLIVNAEGKPVPFYSLRIVYHSALLHQPESMADKDAKIPLPEEWPDGEWFDASDSKTDVSQRYQLQLGLDEYIFQLPEEIKEQDIHVRVINQNGVSIPGYPLHIQIGEQIQQATTDDNGCVPLGQVPVGTEFVVASGYDSTCQQRYRVEPEQDEYIFQIVEEAGPIVVQLLDKNEKPIPNAQLNLTNKRGENFSHYTDQEGCIEVPRSFFTDGERIKVHTVLESMKVSDTSFKFEDQYDHYIIRLKDPFPWGCLWRLLLLLLLALLLFVRCNKDLSVITYDAAENPLPGVQVNLKYTEHQLYKNGEFFYHCDHDTTGITGPDGRIEFPDRPCSVFSWIFYTLQKAYVEGQYGSRTASGSFLFHWRFTDYPLYFTNDAQIKVVRSNDYQPIPGASVILTSEDAACDSISMTTDNQGMCSFSYSDGTKRVIKLLATKQGYSGALYQDFPLSQFDDSVMVIPLDPPSSCDTEVNNAGGRQGSHAVHDFVMGNNVSGKQFYLDYYTDSAPDHIMVYAGSSADYSAGNAKLLWEYDGATNTIQYDAIHHTPMLTLTGDMVCVVVDRGTNWGYYIHCPR